MNVFRQLACRFRALFLKRRLDADMAAEMRAFRVAVGANDFFQDTLFP
jgi:hypothetical protein